MDQRADHRAHLVLQERAGGSGDAHVVAVTCDVETIERLHWRFRLALGGTERGEVVLANQTLCGGMHRFAIERAWYAPGAVLVDREIGAAGCDAGEVSTVGCPEARVE